MWCWCKMMMHNSVGIVIVVFFGTIVRSIGQDEDVDVDVLPVESK